MFDNDLTEKFLIKDIINIYFQLNTKGRIIDCFVFLFSSFSSSVQFISRKKNTHQMKYHFVQKMTNLPNEFETEEKKSVDHKINDKIANCKLINCVDEKIK